MFRNPSVSQLRHAASRLGINPADDYLASVHDILRPLSDAYAALDRLPDNVPEVKYPRSAGYRPGAAENPLGIWYRKTSIKGKSGGPLAGKKIALKDNVCLAGVPMMNGASLYEGYVPDVDATVATRILDAGGEITGKVVCEYYCVSGGSHTSATGPVHNPRKPGYSAGGSSSGSAAVVAAGEADMAIGGDQAGSVRIPASYCGVYGMKPTYGLVPYSGIVGLEPTIDHCGPLAATVSDNALLLSAIAGVDGMDGRQCDVKVADYRAALGRGVDGMKIAIVKEGFGLSNSEPDVDAKVREGAQRLAELGARVDEVSIPMHRLGFAVWAPIAHDGGYFAMMESNGIGTGGQGLYVTSLLNVGANWRTRGDELADTIKIMALFGRYSLDQYRGHYYGKAQNLRRALRAAYDVVLADYDLLLMPTLALKATPLPAADAGVEEVIARSWEMIGNTCPFDVSGHPAMSIPCGMGDGRPIGLMLIGRHWDEPSLYRAAAAFEADGDWTKF